MFFDPKEKKWILKKKIGMQYFFISLQEQTVHTSYIGYATKLTFKEALWLKTREEVIDNVQHYAV